MAMSPVSSFGLRFSCLVALSVVSLPQLFLRRVAADDDINWPICRVEFADKDEKLKIVKACAEQKKFPLKLNLTVEEIKKEVDGLKSKDFDDGCFAKCLFEQTNMLEADGKVAMGKFDEFYKNSNIKPELLTEIKTLFEGCVKESEASFKDQKELPCKMYSMIQMCIISKAITNHKKLEEICKK